MLKKRKGIDVFRAISNPFTHKSNKKGQITIFIILGLVILLAAGLLFLFRSQIMEFRPGEVTPTEKGRVENFITACMADISEEALFLVGQQGGYVEVPQEIAKDAAQSLKTSPLNSVPYWAEGTRTRIPSLEKIKQDLDYYMQKNLRDCLLEMNAFQESYDLVEQGPLIADTQIVDNKVLFNVNWNLEIRNKAGETISELNQFQVESAVKLKQLHDTAQAIVEEEMRSFKLEDITQDLLSVGNDNVPLMGVELNCQRKEWDVQSVKESFQEMLRLNLRQLKVDGTKYAEFSDDYPYYQNHYLWNVISDFSAPEISVLFNYDNNYPFTFQVTPQEYGKMHSGIMGGADLLSFLCLQMWKFVYDVEYPVLITVRDEQNNYNFNFAVTVHIVKNVPNRNSPVLLRDSSSSNYVTSEKYCSNAKTPMTVQAWELIDNAAGIYNKEPLDGAEISFACLQYSCEMGKTEFDFANHGYQAALSTFFPYCVGGIVKAEKESYLEDWENVLVEDNKIVNLELIPLLEIPLSKISVVKHSFTSPDQPLGGEQQLGKAETALLKMTFYKNGVEFHKIEQVLGAIDEESAQDVNVEFLGGADFTYDLEITLFDDKGLLGGYKGTWTPFIDQLENADEIVFHTLASSSSSDEKQFQMFTNLEQYSVIAPLPEIK